MRFHRPPDDLTPRERQVLDFIRLGLTNEEIAARLGITLDGAKYHVSQILSKLGVATREEAAAAPPAPGRRWWAALPLAAKLAGAAVVVASTAGIAVLVWGVLATGAPTGDENASTGVLTTRTPVPWIDATPGPTPSPSPFPTANAVDLAVRPCEGPELEARILGSNVFSLASAITYVGLRNRSATECRLQGVPGVQLLSAVGRPLSANIFGVPCPTGLPPDCPPVLPAVLKPGVADLKSSTPMAPGQGTIQFYSGSGGERPCPTSGPPATILRLVLPQGAGHADISLTEESPNGWTLGTCDRLGVGAFISVTPTPPPEPRPYLTARLELPDTAVAGDTLKFVADLTNASAAAPLVFGDLCPEYTVILGPKVAQEWHALNCHPVASIGPGDTLSFAMQLAIPSNVAPGSYALQWTLMGGTYYNADAGRGLAKPTYTINVVAP